jgi:HflK-like membrane protein
MPPNNQNGGGRKGGGPWSQGPSGGQRNQPNLEELLKRGQDKCRQAIPGGSESTAHSEVGGCLTCDSRRRSRDRRLS